MLFVIHKDGKPYELGVADAETDSVLSGIIENPQYAFASTNQQAVAAMVTVLPALVDLDEDSNFEIVEYNAS